MIYDWNAEKKPSPRLRVYIGGILAPMLTFYADTEKGIVMYYIPDPITKMPFYRHVKECSNPRGFNCSEGCGVAFEEVKLTDPSLLTVEELV